MTQLASPAARMLTFELENGLNLPESNHLRHSAKKRMNSRNLRHTLSRRRLQAILDQLADHIVVEHPLDA
jgi:hypothetical protein